MLTMAAVAGERGYCSTHVDDLLERAQISRRTFYVYFENREDCFFAAYDAIVADVSQLLDADGTDLQSRLSRLLGYLADWPAHARVLLMEVLAPGPTGAERHEQTMADLADRLTDCPPWQPNRDTSQERTYLAQATLGAMLRIIQRTLVTQGPEALRGLVPVLVAMTTELRLAA